KPVQLAVLRAILEKWLPPPDAAPAQRPPVDVQLLESLVGDDPAVIEEFLRDFGASARLAQKRIRASCETGNAIAVAAEAHKLKSSARSVGALALGQLCEQMERHGNAASSQALQQLLPRFEAEIGSVCRYLETLETGRAILPESGAKETRQ